MTIIIISSWVLMLKKVEIYGVNVGLGLTLFEDPENL